LYVQLSIEYVKGMFIHRVILLDKVIESMRFKVKLLAYITQQTILCSACSTHTRKFGFCVIY